MKFGPVETSGGNVVLLKCRQSALDLLHMVAMCCNYCDMAHHKCEIGQSRKSFPLLRFQQVGH